MDLTAILNLMCWLSTGLGAGTAARSPVFEVWAQSAASILISSLWQGTLLACGLALCLKLAPAMPARLRYGIWAAGFSVLVGLPFLPALIQRLTPAVFSPAPVPSLGLAAAAASHPLLALDARWSLVLVGFWLAASLLRAASLCAHAMRMSHLWHSASPISAAHGGVLGHGVDGPRAASIQLCVTSDLDRPCVIGFFRPRILIPAWLLSRLTPAELEQVVLHESEHLRRWDDWANLVQKLFLVVFPLNPALWWIERRLCAEREMACDDGVVGRTHAPRAYAACLAGLAEKGLKHREAALSLGAWRRRPELAERVHRLLRRRPVLSPAASAASVALVGCSLVAGTLGLARCPQLVAFVSPANHAQDSLSASALSGQFMGGDVRTDFTEGSSAFTRLNPQPYRAVKTLAIMPSTRRANLDGSGNRTAHGVSSATGEEAWSSDEAGHTGHSLASLVPAAVAAQMNARHIPASSAPAATQTSAGLASSPEASEAQTSWIVLTTFEEVQTTGSDSQMQEDAAAIDTSANRGAEALGANGMPGAKPAISLSVTRLVLRLEHPLSSAQPASKADPNSKSTQPFAIPYRDGWLVIQL